MSWSFLLMPLFLLVEGISHEARKAYLRLLNTAVPLHLRSWWGVVTRKDHFSEAMRKPKDVVELLLTESDTPLLIAEFPNGLRYILGRGDAGLERFSSLIGRIHWYAETPPERKYHPPVQDPEMTAIPVFGPKHGITAVPMAEFSPTRHETFVTSILPSDAPPEMWQLTAIPGSPRSSEVSVEVIEVWGADTNKRRHG